MSRLFSYRIPVDDGAAPNPYGGICTLAICKPRIRGAAGVGNWVTGTGSKHSPIGNIEEKVVYAMKVTQVMSMAEYDAWSREACPVKVLDRTSRNLKNRLGDSIYDFSSDSQHPILRPGLHTEDNRKTDLGGRNVLLSDYFFYFGDAPVPLPDYLLPIVKKGQGHRSDSNRPYFEAFVHWIEGLGLAANTLHGEPQVKLDNAAVCARVAEQRRSCAEEDLNVGDENEE